MTQQMDNAKAVMIAEEPELADDEQEVLDAWQHLVDTGLAWTLQGWFGRTAAALLDAGEISYPAEAV